MTAFEFCGINTDQQFRVGNSSIVWDSAVYKDRCDKVYISRVITDKGSVFGKPFIIGMRYASRYISPDTKINVKP